MSSKFIKSPVDKIFDIGNHTIILLFSLSVVYPFWHLFILSISSPAFATSLGLKILPQGLNLKAYIEVFNQEIIGIAYMNTVIRSVVGSFLSIIFTTAGAYSLSKKRMPLRTFFTALIIFTMFFSGGLIPTYMLIKGLGMINTIWSLIIPPIINAFNLIIVRNYMSTLPDSLEESACIDGANDIVILYKIILPMCIPVIATVTLWTIVGHWNAWFDAYIYANKNSLIVLQLMLRRVILENDMDNVFSHEFSASTGGSRTFTDNTLKAATLFVSIGPIIFVYPFIQKYFIKGIMIGSLKG